MDSTLWTFNVWELLFESLKVSTGYNSDVLYGLKRLEKSIDCLIDSRSFQKQMMEQQREEMTAGMPTPLARQHSNFLA